MSRLRWPRRVAPYRVFVACLWLAMTVFTAGAGQAQSTTTASSSSSSSSQDENVLVIKTDAVLPEAYPHTAYLVRLVAVGGSPSWHWRLLRGALPPGIKLEEDGMLHGAPERGGDFQFTAFVRDSTGLRAVKDFTIHVYAALSLKWKSVAHVNGNRIEGSAEVSNTTPDDIDLTFIVMAVAENGRATAIGYQHFSLVKGTIAQELPFGDTLPPGAYVVHVDAVGEVAPKRYIYRERMQMPKPLRVIVGP